MSKTTVFKRMMTNTKKNIARNKWLSIATILVVYLTFLIASSIVALEVISSKTVRAFERKAQIIIFFNTGTSEEEILKIQGKLEDTGLVENIEYVSQEEALEIYKEDFEDDPSLVDYITADALPPSIELRAQKISDMDKVLEYVNNLKDENENIEDIMYFQDVIDKLQDISNIINTGGIAVISVLSLVSFVLILIAITFNLNSHKQEIETMQLIGSTRSYIRVPYLLEGTLYGFLGSILAIASILTVWYAGIALLKDSDLFYFITQTFSEIDASYLVNPDPVFIIKVILAEITAGTLIGFLSSTIAIWRHLK